MNSEKMVSHAKWVRHCLTETSDFDFLSGDIRSAMSSLADGVIALAHDNAILDTSCSLCHIKMGTGSCKHLLELGDGRVVLPRHVWEGLVNDRIALRRLRETDDD